MNNDNDPISCPLNGLGCNVFLIIVIKPKTFTAPIDSRLTARFCLC